MASLTSPRPRPASERRRVSLEASEALRERDGTEVRPVGWPVAAVVGGLATAAVGWLAVTALVVCGWLMGDEAGLPAALGLGTRLWLLTGGVPVRVGGLELSLVPWGGTVLTAVLLWRFGAYAGRRVTASAVAGPWAVAGVVTAAFALPVLATAVFLGEPWRAPLRWAAVVLVLLLAARAGAGQPLRCRTGASWPTGLRGLPRAVAASVAVLLLAGAGVLVLGLVTGWDRVVGLSGALHAGVPGTVLLVVIQASLLPNALVWSGSYALGAGFSLGGGSVVAPAATTLGVLPDLPVLGALPSAGPGSTLQLWWLVAGALAGAVAAWVVLRERPTRRVDTTTLLGGLAGLAAALVFTGLAWTTSGDLGGVQLSGLGPRLLPLLVMSTTTLGLAGTLTGAVTGLVRHRRRPREDAAEVEEAEVEETGAGGAEAVDGTAETEQLAR